MSQQERKLADATGRFTIAVKNGQRQNEVSWRTGRILLSNRRLVIADNDNSRTIPLSDITGIGDRVDVNQAIASVPDYLSLRLEDDVLLLAPDEVETFELQLYQAILDGATVLVRHPALKGGVVQETTFERGRVKLSDADVVFATASGTLVQVELGDVSAIEAERRTVKGSTRPVLGIEHTDDGTSVRTELAGKPHHLAVIKSYLHDESSANRVDLDLEQRHVEVLMALYSGVNPFDIPDFVGLEVDAVEAIFAELIDLDVLDEVRVRTEVELTARGRNLASEAMSDQ